jgi:hypothetical protein
VLEAKGAKAEDVEKSTEKKGSYDPLKREPKWANAEAVPLFELV